MTRLFPVAAVSLALCACSTTPELVAKINPFKIDVRQGNYVSQDMVAQLKPGQTKDQVRFILGTPLVADIFHAERWDYIYSFKPGRGEAQLRRFAVFFVDNKLARVAGDVVGAEPGEAEAAATVAAGARSRVIEIAPDTEKKKEEAKEGEHKTGVQAQPDGEAQPAEKH